MSLAGKEVVETVENSVEKCEDSCMLVSKDIKQFCTISLLNIEGKISFSVLAGRMTAYKTANEYINTSVQKGGVPGFSGCVEHIIAITQLVREAKINNSLTVVWLNLANAYGSVPSQLIFKALNHYFITDGHIVHKTSTRWFFYPCC